MRILHPRAGQQKKKWRQWMSSSCPHNRVPVSVLRPQGLENERDNPKCGKRTWLKQSEREERVTPHQVPARWWKVPSQVLLASARNYVIQSLLMTRGIKSLLVFGNLATRPYRMRTYTDSFVSGRLPDDVHARAPLAPEKLPMCMW